MNSGKTLFAQLTDFLPWSTFTRIADNSGFNPPLFGTPFTVFAGLRVKFN